MQTIKYKDELHQVLEFPGIAACKLKHKLSATEADFTYAGPKISYDEWHKVLSFFRWTYKEHRSESQVRGFINLNTNKIIFWAFPQECGTGMTSKEIPGDDFNAQRAALPDTADLVYFLTVHHHCGMSAFQSHGDENNEARPGGGNHETGQDGLHITVGRMDEKRHDMDFRFYIKGVKLVPNLSQFWDIGQAVSGMVPESLHHSIALFQMCEKVDLEFPKQWQENYRKPKSVEIVKHTYQGGMGYAYGGVGASWQSGESLYERIGRCAGEVVDDLLTDTRIQFDDLVKVFEFLEDSSIVDALLTRAMQERFDAVDIKNMIKAAHEGAQDMKEELIEELSGQDQLDKPVKKRKNRRQRIQVQVETTTTINGKPSVNDAQPAHGQLSADQGSHWDSDLKTWVDNMC